MAVRIYITVLQSIETAFMTNVTVSLLREIALGETLLCQQSIEMAVRRDKTVSQPVEIAFGEI